jgi:hypothetical protein
VEGFEGQLDGLRRLGADRARLEELLRFQVQGDRAGGVIGSLKRIGCKWNDSGWGTRIDSRIGGDLYAELQGDERGILMQLARVGRPLENWHRPIRG